MPARRVSSAKQRIAAFMQGDNSDNGAPSEIPALPTSES